jgi:hypothetical protein
MNPMSKEHQRTSPEVLTSVITYQPSDPAAWKRFVEEFPRANLSRIALFLTGLDPKGRKECYAALSRTLKTHPFSIPFVHARNDMHPDEYDFLTETFGTVRFNLHPARSRSYSYDLPARLRERIYIENIGHNRKDVRLEERDLEGFAGICLDFAHLEMERLNIPEYYRTLTELLDRIPIGANHVSAVTRVKGIAEDIHAFQDLSEFDYIRDIPRTYVADFVALELCEPLEKQMQVKVMLEEMWC